MSLEYVRARNCLLRTESKKKKKAKEAAVK